MLLEIPIPEIQTIDSKLISVGSCSLSVLREDRIHPFVSGNKYRKLKYNLKDASESGYDTLLTFGGAFSNHIAAVASAGKHLGFKTIGVIRGEELADKLTVNPTLTYARECGMHLHFVSRNDYKRKEDASFLETLHDRFGRCYIIPEGGTNLLAVKGCAEILSKGLLEFDYICTSVGTGGTLAGIVSAASASQMVLGFSALKGDFQISEVKKYTQNKNYKIIDDYCFGGYAKIDLTLIRFINDFKEKTQIPLDPVYTGKMMFGVLKMISEKKIKENSRILAVHTGGLQGIAGMNQVLLKKNLPQLI